MNEVVIVTGPACPHCQMLKMMLNHMGLDAPREVSTDSPDGMIILAKSGARAIPVLAKVVDGEPVAWAVGSHKSDELYRSLYEV